MEQSLVDRYCAQAHLTGITGAATDPASGAVVTADGWGTVAITRPGAVYPAFIFEMGHPVQGAVAVSSGGALVAVGDDQGSVAVFKTWDGACVFEDVREGEAGAHRAMRALAFNPAGTVLASLSIDGVVRLFDLQTWQRVGNYPSFGGESLQFDLRGERLLAIDNLGQPKLLDLLANRLIDLELVPGGVRRALFTADNRGVLAIGQSGLTLIRLPEGHIAGSFTARGSSGMLNVVMSPDGRYAAALTRRSVHLFELPALVPRESEKHRAPDPTGAVLWDAEGVAVASADGRLYRPGAKPSLGPVVCCGGFGEHRVAAHGSRIAVWKEDHQKRPFDTGHGADEVRIDRDGRLLLVLPDDHQGLVVYEARTGRELFRAGQETADTPLMEVGGSIVACRLKAGGLKWWDLKTNKSFELPWVETFALSGSGTWMAVTTPKGQVRVLDPTTGKDAIPAPTSLAEAPVALMSFVNRRPDLLVLDAEGVLGHFDLTRSQTERVPAVGRDVLELKVDVDRLWGITGGRLAAVRFQEPEQKTATVIYVDLRTSEVVSEVKDLLPYVWLDPESGNLLQPARGGAILELDLHGKEARVLRALAGGEWVAFDRNGVLQQSPGARLE